MESEVMDEQVQEATIENAPEQDLLDLLIVLLKRWRFVFWFTFGAAAAAAIATLFIPNKYTATTLILPPAQNSSASSALLGQLGGTGALASVAGATLGMKNPGDMYVSLFRSITVEDTVIQRFKLLDRYRVKRLSDARLKFEERSNVVLGVKDGLILVSVTDRDPNEAAAIANGYVDEFRKFSAGLAITEASQRREFFQQQLLEANENLAAAEEAMKHTEQSTGVLQVDSQAKALIESAAILRGQIGMKEVELQGMRSYATEDNPQMVRGEQQLTALKKQLAQLAGADQNLSSDVMLPKGKIPEAGMEYLRKVRDVKYYETITGLIARQFEVAKQDEARQGAIVQVADVAMAPDKRSSPHRVVIVVLMTLIAFVVAMLWVLAAAQFQMMLHDPVRGRKIQTLRELFFNRQR